MPTVGTITARWRAGLVGSRLPAALAHATGSLAGRVANAAPVESGALRDSVHAIPVRAAKGRLTAAVVVSSDHALAVEYGTHDMAPEPFFRPAIRGGRDHAAAIVAREAR